MNKKFKLFAMCIVVTFATLSTAFVLTSRQVPRGLTTTARQERFDGLYSYATQKSDGVWHIIILSPFEYNEFGRLPDIDRNRLAFFQRANSTLEFWGKTAGGDVLILAVRNDGNAHNAYAVDYSGKCPTEVYAVLHYTEGC